MSSTLAAESASHGPGLWARTFLRADGTESAPLLTNIRVAGEGRKAGSGLINVATGLLFALAIGLFAVSVSAQYTYVFHVKHAHVVSVIEAISLDCAMAIFSLLALGLARAGKAAKIERALVLVCALASAGMNYAAADVLSPRSILAYVAPPLLLSVVVDRVVAVVRRHVLGEDEVSPWRPVGKAALYLVRLVIAPVSTLSGARRAVLTAAPVPEKPKPAEPIQVIPAKIELPQRGPIQELPARPVRAAIERPKPTRAASRKPATAKGRAGSKTSQFLELVAQEHGPLSGIELDQVYKISAEISAKVDLDAGSARTALRKAILAAQAGEQR